MKRLLAAIAIALALSSVTPIAFAQDAPPAPPASIDPSATDDESTDKPWGRLAIFIPVSAALGVGAVYGRRIARERGWTRG
jgi:hypothetical protein